MPLKIIHIFRDEKFPDAAHSVFESAFPNQNEFIIFSNSTELKFVKRIVPTFYNRLYLYSKQLIRKACHADVIVFHGLDWDALRILKALPNNTKTIWLGWGYDYYDLTNLPLYKEKTTEVVSTAKTTVKAQLKTLIKKLIRPEPNKKKLINKVNVFSPVLYEDFELVKKAIPNFTPKYASWNYGTLEDDLIRGFEGKTITGNNILLGNSASYNNNHLDAFDSLSALDLNGKKIITPLSYGDIDYRNLIISEGHKKFGDTFVPLIDFMPIDEYIAVLQSCSIVVMNHLRHQALGNIVIALYLGAKVFLDKRNPIYQFFIKNDACIYCLEELEAQMQENLTGEQIDRNRRVLQNYWSRDVILQKTKNIVDSAINIENGNTAKHSV